MIQTTVSTLVRIGIVLFAVITATISRGQDLSYKKDSLTQDFETIPYEIKRIDARSTFFKAGIGVPLFQQSSISSNFKTVSIDALVEHKIWKSIFVTAGLETTYSFGRKVEMFNLNVPIALRHYFSLSRKNTISSKNIFRQYIALQSQSSLFSSFFYDRSRIDLDFYYRGTRKSTIVNTGQYLEGPNLFQFVYLRVGSQFKIKTSNFLDISIVVPVRQLVYNKNDNGFTLSSPAILTVKYGLIITK